ncbi:Probable RNA-directed DNA polymerase from transposon X-element [Eumeta japonica]|uniref:Probable RNA-directed DNA polymerase from transposon X-element n=1 Tax=Eumeta variegata TaxID=151549 RepID=A0A4C1SMV1_EUMVA|nr:Probable RNA-directed DNA polymerase from transposon X-element [Eumeta japonica]
MRSIGIRVGSSEQEIRLFAAYRPRVPGYVFRTSTLSLAIKPHTRYRRPQRQTPRRGVALLRAGRLLMEDAERHGYEEADASRSRVRHVHATSAYFVTVGTGTSNSSQAALRQRVDWENFEKSLEALHLGSSFEIAADVEASAKLLVDKIKETQVRATTLLPASTSRRGDLPLSIKRRLRFKRRLHKLWTGTRCPKLKQELNDLSRNTSEAVKDFRGATWEATIDCAGESARDLNQFCRQLTKAAAPNCPVTDRSGVRRYDAKARAEVIAEYLAEKFIPNPPATSPKMQEHYIQVENRVEEFMVTAPPPLPGDLFITPAALHKIVIRLPKKKAPGPDGISTAALWHLPEGQLGKIITIPKAEKDPRKPENIQPITVLSHVAKTFECALLTKLRLFLTPRKEQYALRSGHSTTLQLIRVLHHFASEGNCGRCTVAVLLDMGKAFDRVWHGGLIHKLLDPPLPPALIRVVTGFLQRLSFCVAVDDVLSAHARYERGTAGPEEYSAPYDCGAGWYVKNDVIARPLRVETVEEFVRMLARRASNRADAGPYLFLHNLAHTMTDQRKDTSSHETWYQNRPTKGRCELTHTGQLTKVTTKKDPREQCPP